MIYINQKFYDAKDILTIYSGDLYRDFDKYDILDLNLTNIVNNVFLKIK